LHPLLDASGESHVPVLPGEARIASLVPSLTDACFTLGLGDRLVARTGFCVHPAPDVTPVPVVGGTKSINVRRLKRFAPTHVLVNIDENRLETVDEIRAAMPDVHIVATHPCTPQDSRALVLWLGALFGRSLQAEAWASEFDLALDQARQSRSVPDERVLYLIWRAPWMTVARDTYVSAMLRTVGWHTVPDFAGGPRGAARYPIVVLDDGILRQADRVLLSSEPYEFSDDDASALGRETGKSVTVINGEMISWFGTRTVQGLRYLARLRVNLTTPSAPSTRAN
jgi:ABC-type Fe3+-hydroxamate transport system substrate-binding protein